jgi:hypothetical protein
MIDIARKMAMKLEHICDDLNTARKLVLDIANFPASSQTMMDITHKIEESDRDGKEKLVQMKRLIEKETIRVLSENVKQLLIDLYSELEKEEEKEEENAPAEPASEFKKLVRELYSEIDQKKTRLVGPVGERPIHVCAILAARYRIEVENHGISISEGIIQGMKMFLEDKENQRFTAEEFGKDYCAAVCNLLRVKAVRFPDHDINLKLPLFNYLKHWYSYRVSTPIKVVQNGVSTGASTSNIQADKASEPLDHPGDYGGEDDHVEAIVLRGLYEGETIIYPFVASNDERALRWLLNLKLREFPEFPDQEGR